MRKSREQIWSVVLLAFWTFCLFNGAVERATAHWHVQSSGKFHHHHHPLGNSDTHHEGEPDQDSGHDADGAECCQAQVPPSTSLAGNRTIKSDFETIFSLPAAGLLAVIWTVEPSLSFALFPIDGPIFLHLAARVAACRVGNAPPLMQ